MKIAIVGCVHGELDRVYRDIQEREKEEGVKIELVLICGDFQTIRNNNDLQCMAVPQKFLSLGTFHEYYSGIRRAPYLTLFIGGNHEASNYLSTLPYGGWVAENIYYLGYAGVVRFGGLRIGGVSGIHKSFDAQLGHFERLPYDRGTIRSVYHTRALDAYRMMLIANDKDPQPLDIVLSHDWPLNIHTCGNVGYLLKKKPFFRSDVQNNALGNPLYEPLIPHLKPRHWFSAHLHVRFEATVYHDDTVKTHFLALDKCLPRRPYFDFLDISPKSSGTVAMETPVEEEPKFLEYDPEWLKILQKTDRYMSSEKFPRVKVPQMWIITDPVTELDIQFIQDIFANDMSVPHNFAMSEPVTSAEVDIDPERIRNFPNPQTVTFCEMLNLTDPISEIVGAVDNEGGEIVGAVVPAALHNPDEINLDDDDLEDEVGITENDAAKFKRLKKGNEDVRSEASEMPLFIIDTKGNH